MFAKNSFKKDNAQNLQHTVSAHKEPALLFALVVLIVLFSCISLGLMVFHWNINGLLFLLIFGLCVIAHILKYSFKEVLDIMVKEIINSLPALFILILVAATISCWMISGTIPTMISIGLKYLSPESLLPATFLISSMTSVVIGTSWGTVGTIGLVAISLSQAIGISPAMTAGAVISGACFGDKISPLSDTTNLASMASDVPLQQHMRSMFLTAAPTYIITLIVFCILSTNEAKTVTSTTEINALLLELKTEFVISPITLIPIFVLIILGIRKVDAIVAIASGILTSGILAVLLQKRSFAEVLSTFDTGFSTSANHSELFLQLTNRGGIMSMMSIFVFTLMVISIGSLLNQLGFLRIIVAWIARKIRRPASIVVSTIGVTMVSAMATGDSYMPIILTGKLFRGIYDNMGIHRSVLSRCCEDGATLLVPIIPWAATAIYFSGALGVPTIEYLPYAIFCWLNPVVSILMSICGIGVIWANQDGSQKFCFHKKADMK